MGIPKERKGGGEPMKWSHPHKDYPSLHEGVLQPSAAEGHLCAKKLKALCQKVHFFNK